MQVRKGELWVPAAVLLLALLLLALVLELSAPGPAPLDAPAQQEADGGALAPWDFVGELAPEQAEEELLEAAAAEERAEEQLEEAAAAEEGVEEQAAAEKLEQAEKRAEAQSAAEKRAEEQGAALWPGTGSTCVSASSRLDPLVATRLAERCGYYTSEVVRWRERASHADATTVVTYAQRSGLGDRMSGLVSSFHAAMGSGARMHVKWYGNNALAPSCLLNGIFSGVDNATSANRLAVGDMCEEPRAGCIAARKDRLMCNGAAANVSIPHRRMLIIACAPPRVCGKLQEDAAARKQIGYGLVETAGCPLRMQYEVSDELHELPVRWFADGKEHEGPLRQLAAYLVRHRVIATHVRIGDWALLHRYEGTLQYHDATLKCIQSVDANLSDDHEDHRPVKWLIAADTQGLRDWFLQNHADKLVMLLEPPVHIDKHGKRDAYTTTMNTFAEWYAMSLSSELISAHRTHRASAFSKSAWLWSLRDRYYKLVLGKQSSCSPAVYSYEGTFASFRGRCDVEFRAYLKAQKAEGWLS